MAGAACGRDAAIASHYAGANVRLGNDKGPNLAERALGKADETADIETNYRAAAAPPQWIVETSAELVTVIVALRKLFPTRPLPSYVQRALAAEWRAS
jgi:hypothetical protein